MDHPLRFDRCLLSVLAAVLLACAHSPTASSKQHLEVEDGDGPAMLVAQSCSPGMSCFGHVVLLPSGEVAETAATAAAATAAAAAAATATAQSQKDTTTKTKKKSAEEEKVDVTSPTRRKVTCQLVGGGVKKHPRSKLRCSYWCPGEPPGVVHDVLLDIDECPPLWDFYL